MGQERDFLDRLETRLTAIQNGAVPLFARVYTVDSFDESVMKRILRIPRYPCAVIVNGNFTINQSNGKVKNGLFDVVIIHARPRDVIGTFTTKDIADFGDLMIAAMEYESNQMSIQNAAGGGGQTISLSAGILYKARTFNFTYQIRYPA